VEALRNPGARRPEPFTPILAAPRQGAYTTFFPPRPYNDPVTSRSTHPYLWMLAGSLAFAVMGTLAHALGDRCPWQLGALARSALVLVFALGMARAAGVRLVFLRPASLWWRSTAGSLSVVGTFYALTRLPVPDVLTLTNMFPVWVALLAWPVLGERPTAGVALAVGCAVLGVALIEKPHLDVGNPGVPVALGVSLSTAVAMMGLHRLRGIDARAIVVHFSAVSVVASLLAVALFDRPDAVAEVPGAATLAMLLGIGVTATVGQLCLTRAFAEGAPAKVSVVGLTQVVFALLLEEALGPRALRPEALAGIALVLAPTVWLTLHRPAVVAHRLPPSAPGQARVEVES
jgi:drug/metabolite transporter (DMT)-like permease